MEEDFSKFIRGFSITSVGVIYVAITFYGAALLTINLLGPTQYGLYSLAYLIPNVAIYFLLFGLDVTIARYIAHNLGKNNKEKALACAQTIFLVRVIVAVGSVVVFFFLSEPLANLLGEDITLGLQLLSVYIGVYLVSRYLMAVLQGYFLIKERTIAEVLLNTLNLILLIPLVYLGFGYLSPILSFLVAFVFTAVIALFYLERAQVPVFRVRFEGVKALKEYLQFSFYVYLTESFYITYIWVGTIVIKLYAMSVETVGYYRAMFSITNTVVIISYGLTIVLYPMLSELNARKEYERLAFSLQKVITYTLALSIPAAFGVLLLSDPFVAVLFPEYLPAVALLKIFSFRMIFLPLWAVLSTALLTLDRARKQAFISVVLCSMSFVLSLVLGMFSVGGIALANSVVVAVAVGLQYWVLKQRVAHVNAGPVLKFCFSSAVMCACVWLILQAPLGDAAKVFLSIVCGVVVYFLVILKIRAVTKVDLEIMRSAVSAFGRVGTVLESVIDVAQKIQEL
ncbi:MAG: oligosaccharide flippase family protein [Theionarchaea archaeon]|nr:MAG: hypothetical protein AYK19_15500 [Theionarchaea archaeon DG-70-1]MBU7029187.1 oligosaccharide flippase family protein [Theionarchaea archaeon]